VASNVPVVHPPDGYMNVDSNGVMILTKENRRTQRKTCPSATLSTINPIRTDQSANPGLRSERLATNSLSHGMTSYSLKTTVGGDLLSGCFKWWMLCINSTDLCIRIYEPCLKGYSG
jgi:hypothetical protein